jgi:hypothetical protein
MPFKKKKRKIKKKNSLKEKIKNRDYNVAHDKYFLAKFVFRFLFFFFGKKNNKNQKKQTPVFY